MKLYWICLARMQLIDYDIGYDQLLSSGECQDIVDWFLERIESGEIEKYKAKTRQEATKENKYDTYHRKGNTASAHGFPYERDIIDSIMTYSQDTGIRIYQDKGPGHYRSVSWQFTIYDDEGDHFKEHQDQSVKHYLNAYHNNLDQQDPHKYQYRKISSSIQLSDPEAYEGCKLQIRNTRETMFSPPNRRGSVIAFPSYAEHVVTPLTSGVRYAMVGWFHGPHWR